MAALWITLIAVATYMAIITLVVIGQEFSPWISVVAFIALVWGAIKLFQMRVTRL
jgi:hypothetical protein